PWTNRIHIDDLVAVCEAAMTRGQDNEIYNVSDGKPGNMRDYFDRVADLFGLPRAPAISLSEAHATLSPGMLSYLGESRRLDNRKMLGQLGVTLRYPDLASGLASCHPDGP
ncbi:MAG: SDR family NAD(P)-dependent oxidoreductase, partial [Sedimenticolaceae bacterium]